MPFRYRLLLTVTAVVVVLDQLTKLWVVRAMRLGESRVIIEGLLNLTYVRNRGVAFGVLSHQGISAGLFVVFSLVALGLIVYFLRQITDRERLLAFALSAIFAGAVGNVIDRVRLGEVIDFIDLHLGTYHWPFFNLADSAITIGGLLLAITLLRGRRGD